MKKYFLSVVLASLFVSFYSCKKNDQLPEPQPVHIPEIGMNGSLDRCPPEEDQWDRAKNEANEYDGNGFYHNLAVDYIFANVGLDSSSENLFDLAIESLGDEFGTAYGDSIDNLIDYEDAEPYFDVVNSFSRSAFQTAIATSSYSSAVKAELNNLLDILTDTLDPDYTQDYDELRERIVDWEAAVSASGTLGQNDKIELLRSGSVARFSTLYWRIYDSVYVEGTTNKGGFLRWLGWALVGAADAMGFFVGSSGCGPGCGVAVGAAGSVGAFVIFRGRGWDPY